MERPDFKSTINSISFTHATYHEGSIVRIEKQQKGDFKCFSGMHGSSMFYNMQTGTTEAFETIDEAVGRLEEKYTQNVIGPLFSLETKDFVIRLQMKKYALAYVNAPQITVGIFETADEAYAEAMRRYEEKI